MSKFSDANKAFLDGDYVTAVQLYSALEEERPEMRPSIRFNLELAKDRLPSRKNALEIDPSIGSISHWVKQVRESKAQLTWFAGLSMQTSFEGTRDVLAYAATNGKHGWNELGRILESYRIPLYKQATLDRFRGSGVWTAAWNELAVVLYSQRHSEMDLLDALSMFELIEDLYGNATLADPKNIAVYGDLLTLHSKLEKSQKVLDRIQNEASEDVSQVFLSLNNTNPKIANSENSYEIWISKLNKVLKREGLAPVYFKDPNDLRMLDIQCDAPKVQVENGPKISVLMPIYEPNEYTDLAIQSLLAQTWSNLEVIIVDDASPAFDDTGTPTQYRERLQKWADKDDRIKLIMCEENRGTYAVRNDGLDAATGALITIADKDDWHHPQKLELQARDFMANPDSLANMTNWVRVDEEMRFLVRSRKGQVVYPAFASLMFRRDPVMDRLGYWDRVRKAGDAEFKSRFQTTFGVEITPKWDAPLAISLVGQDNLTSADMRPGYISADRNAYQRAYRSWHKQIEEGQSPYMEKNPRQRKFLAPRSFLPERAELPPATYDVVFLSEFGFLAGNSTSLFQEIQVCLDYGLKVGVLPVKNGLIRSAARQHFHPNIERLISEGRLDRLTLQDVAYSDLLVVRWPASFQLSPGATSRVSVKKIVVVANHMPYEIDGSRRSYDVRTVSDNIKQTFGVRPVWSAQSQSLEQYLAPIVPPGELTSFTWSGIIDPPEAVNQQLPDPKRAPVIGRHARDMAGKWPSTAEDFQKIYPTDGSVRVHIMGGISTPVEAGFCPPDPGQHWKVLPFNGVPVSEYLRSLDFFVYYHSDHLVEAFGMAILEALNQGVVAVLPPHFSKVFGDAAVYARPDEVRDTVRHYWDEERYLRQRELGLAYVRMNCSPRAYLERVQRLGVRADGR